MQKLDITIKNDFLESITHKDNCDVCFYAVNKYEIKNMISKFLDGKRVQLWSDNDPEEPSTIVYVAIKDWKPIQIEDLESLINVINDSNVTSIYKVMIQDSLL